MMVLSVAVAVGGGWFYFHDEQQRNERWYADDAAWNATIITQLTALAEEQAQQRILIDEMKTNQVIRFLQMESSFEELEEEHQAIVTAMYEGLVDINARVAFHQGEHHTLKEALAILQELKYRLPVE